MDRDYKKFIKKGKLVHYDGCSEFPKGDYRILEILEEDEENDIDENTVVVLELENNEIFPVFVDELIESDNETYE